MPSYLRLSSLPWTSSRCGTVSGLWAGLKGPSCMRCLVPSHNVHKLHGAWHEELLMAGAKSPITAQRVGCVAFTTA